MQKMETDKAAMAKEKSLYEERLYRQMEAKISDEKSRLEAEVSDVKFKADNEL